MKYKNFKINGVPIKNPSSFKIDRYNVTTMTRLASAKMVGDLVAKKRKFFFTYSVIDALDLDVILETIWEVDELFFTLEYAENGVTKTAAVYSGSIPTELHNAATLNTNWKWKNVTFDLIEQ